MGTIAVIDYGMGNIHSIKKALEIKGGRVKIASSPRILRGLINLCCLALAPSEMP